ncbi:MAG: hypothetical protein FWC76_04340 [Defluviitaleaceae bacterium]|nr:hypothetical protein [Defluviitaleaceae bacterium]
MKKKTLMLMVCLLLAGMTFVVVQAAQLNHLSSTIDADMSGGSVGLNVSAIGMSTSNDLSLHANGLGLHINNLSLHTPNPIQPLDSISDTFLFNSSHHTVHDLPWETNETIPASFEEFDTAVRNNSNAAIIVGEVAGPSINRIIQPKGENHVITPILIHYVIFLGDEIADMQTGDIINVIEGYYYVTPQTQAYADGFAVGDIMTNRSYWPMESDNRYIIYLVGGAHQIYHYNNQSILSAGFREQVYLLDTSSPIRAHIDIPSLPHYAQWWQDAMEMYGDLEGLPWYGDVPTPPILLHHGNLTAGAEHSLILTQDNTLWAWGDNRWGQVGDGTVIRRNSPTFIMNDVATVSAGGSHTMVIRNDGSLWGWGSNTNGQIGNGMTTDWDFPNPDPIKIMDDVIMVSASFPITLNLGNTMVIRSDGSLWGWGCNAGSQLGDGTRTNRLTPIRIMDDVVYVSAGGFYTMAIRSDGSLWGWGANARGQLGDGTRIERRTPVWIMDDVIAVATDHGHTTMAIRADNSLWAWGQNGRGQLGNGTTVNSYSPIRIMEDVVAISLGHGHAMAIRADGSLWGWGNNGNGQLGDGTRINSHIPIWIMDDVVAVSAGNGHTIATRTDDSVWGWGRNTHGQVGDGTTIDRRTPVLIKGESTLPSALAFNATNLDQGFESMDERATRDYITINWNDEQGRFVEVMITHPDGTIRGPYTGGSVNVPMGSDASFYLLPEYYNLSGRERFTGDLLDIISNVLPIAISMQPYLGQDTVLAVQIFDIVDDIDVDFIIEN